MSHTPQPDWSAIKALFLEAVDEAHHHVAVKPEPGRQLPLRLAVGARQRDQHRIGARMHVERRQPSLEVVGHIAAQLGQQKRNPLVQLPDAGSLINHDATLAPIVIVLYSDNHC